METENEKCHRMTLMRRNNSVRDLHFKWMEVPLGTGSAGMRSLVVIELPIARRVE